MSVFWHWLNVELWGPCWPNLAASAICSAIVYARLRIEQAERHEELKRHVTASMGSSHGAANLEPPARRNK